MSEELPELELAKCVIQRLDDHTVRVLQKREGAAPYPFNPLDVSKYGGIEKFPDALMRTLKKSGLIEEAEETDFVPYLRQLMTGAADAAPEQPAELVMEEPVAETVEAPVAVPSEEEVLIDENAQAPSPPAVEQKPSPLKLPKPPAPASAPALKKPASASEVAPAQAPVPSPEKSGVSGGISTAELPEERLKRLHADFKSMPKAQQEYLEQLARNTYHISTDELLIRYDDAANAKDYPTYWLAMFSADAQAHNADFFQKASGEYCYHTWWVNSDGEEFDATVPRDTPELEIGSIYNLPDLGYPARLFARSESVHKLDTVLTETTQKFTSAPVFLSKDSPNIPSVNAAIRPLIRRMGALYPEIQKQSGFVAVSGIVKSKNVAEKGDRVIYYLIVDDMSLRPPIPANAFRVQVTFEKGVNPLVTLEEIESCEGRNITAYGYAAFKLQNERFPQVKITPQYIRIF